MADDQITDTMAAPPKKRSLFTKSTWAKPREEDQAVEFFSRAKELYPIVVAENERKLQKKAAKLERKRSSISRDREDSNRKKTRVSTETEDEDGNLPSSPLKGTQQDRSLWTGRESTHSTPGSQNSRSSSPQLKNQGSPTTLSGRYSNNLRTERQRFQDRNAVQKGYISLSDSESESETGVPLSRNAVNKPNEPMFSTSRTVNAQAVEEDDLQISDEEFPELVQKAREREKQKDRVSLTAAVVSGSQNNALHSTDSFKELYQSIPELDPTVEIFISSYIEGTKPLLVRRKLSQPLKHVRLSWCDKQVFDGQPMGTSVRDSIFLTWKSKRLFDVTTCKNMGVRSGSWYTDSDGFDEEGRVHMEAWTEELFAEHQKKLEAHRQHGNQASGQTDKAEEEDQPLKEETTKIKLILKSRDLPDYKLMVKPSTLVQKMVNAFRQANEISEEKGIVLHFDGERLDPTSMIADTELGNMDSVEVHVK